MRQMAFVTSQSSPLAARGPARGLPESCRSRFRYAVRFYESMAESHGRFRKGAEYDDIYHAF